MASNSSNNQENNQRSLAVVWASKSNSNSRLTVYTQFLESRVNANVMPSKSNQQKHWSGKHIIDRGFLLLQQSTTDDILFLSFFSREKTNDISPDFIIPIRMIAKMDTACVKSANGMLVKGRVTIITHTTVDARLFLGPMKITIHLSIGGMQALEAALQVGASFFPNQQEKSSHGPPHKNMVIELLLTN